MARKFTLTILAAAFPLLALLSHPELRRLLLWDLATLWKRDIWAASEKLPQPRNPLLDAIQEAEGKSGLERWHAYERLYRQRGEVWLGVFGLRYGMDAVPLARPDLLEQTMPPEKSSPQEAERLLDLATELSERDADNAFPLLVKSYALFALKRDAEALSSYLQAARRPYYRTYEREWLKVRMPKGLAGEERVNEMAAILLPHLSRLREMARLVMSYSAKAEGQGRFDEALWLAEAVTNVGAKWREQGFTVIDALAGASLQRIAWEGKTRKLTEAEQKWLERLPAEKQIRERHLLSARKFAAFTRQHGRDDLAERALKEAEANIQLSQLSSLAIEASFIGDFSPADMRRLIGLRLVGIALLESILALLMAVFLASVFLWRLIVPADRLSPVTATLVTSGLPFAAIILGLRGLPLLDAWAVWEKPSLIATLALPIGIGLLLCLVCFAPAFWQSVRLGEGKAVIPVTGIAAFAGILTITSLYVPSDRLSTPLMTILLAWSIFGLTSAGKRLWQGLEHPKSFWRIVFATLLAVWIFLIAYGFLWLASVVSEFRLLQPVTEQTLLALPLIALTMLAGHLLAFSVWARVGSEQGKIVRQSALVRLRNAAMLLALLCWWGYGLTSFASLPLRNRLHQTLDNFALHGELALLRKIAR